MQNKNDKSCGQSLTNNKENGWQRFLKKDKWKYLVGSPLIVWAGGVIKAIGFRAFLISCADYYGVDSKYFHENEWCMDNIYMLFLDLVLLLVPCLLIYANKKINSKIYAIILSAVMLMIFFLQNSVYVLEIVKMCTWNWMKVLFKNSVFGVILLGIIVLSDAIIIYFIMLRDVFVKKRDIGKKAKITIIVALLVYIIITSVGLGIRANYDISDKKKYEIINESRVIISNYEGKFVVMDCEIQGDNLFIKKGVYRLEDMTGVSIKYHEFEQVICR